MLVVQRVAWRIVMLFVLKAVLIFVGMFVQRAAWRVVMLDVQKALLLVAWLVLILVVQRTAWRVVMLEMIWSFY